MRALLIAIVIFAGSWLATPQRADCQVSCYNTRCRTSNVCGKGCGCMKKGYDTYGVCVRFN